MTAGHPADAFLPFLSPIIDRASACIDSAIHGLAAATTTAGGFINRESVSASLVEELSHQLLSAAGQALELELRAAAGSHLLAGRDPRSRFTSFMRELCEPSRTAGFFREYRPLQVLLAGIVDRWAVASSECLGRWFRDAEELRGSLLPGRDPVLIGIEAGAGDRHRGGRSVSVLRFDDGSAVVYKPRPVRVDVHFHGVLEFLNGVGGGCSLRTLRLVDRQDYGWTEFAWGAPCRSLEQVGRFYERQGRLLAVLHLLGATDMHAGNLIACGEDPVLVDLETLFHPLGSRGSVFHDESEPVRHALLRSVMRIGLVPIRFWGTEDSRGVDFSGLGGQPDQLTPRPVPVWTNAGTDRMRIETRRIPFEARNNFPTLGGEAVSPLDFQDRVLAGFEQAYRALQDARSTILRRFFPQFAGDRIRILLRPTDTYQRMVYDGLRPDMLWAPGARETHFGRLPELAEPQDAAAAIAAAELADLLENDIPYFSTTADSCDLTTARGDSIPGYFPSSGLAEAQARYLQFSEEDLKRQKSVIEVAFLCMARDIEESTEDLPMDSLVGPNGGGG